MSRLEELITELCPNGVESVPLHDVCSDFIVPMRDRPKVFDGDIPWCRIEDKEGQYFHKSLSGLGVSEDIIQKMNLKVFPVGTVICSCSASLGAYAINTQPLITNQTFIGLVCRESLYNKYLLYFMETQTKNLQQLATKGTIPYISRNKFEELQIPLPPLEVQREIVRILDAFTELTAELTAELDARKKQYEYYRDDLLIFEDDIHWKTIGELTHVFSAARVHRNEWTTEGVPFFRSSDVVSISKGIENPRGKAYISLELYEKLSAKSGKISKGDILITGGGSIGIPYIVPTDDPLYVKDADLICIQKTPLVNTRFLYHYFNSTMFRNYLMGITHDATIAHYTISQIQKTPIPLPPLAEQERIVAILDRFDKLCNDISVGIPAEIEARRKQYEHYRDRLLTFKEKTA